MIAGSGAEQKSGSVAWHGPVFGSGAGAGGASGLDIEQAQSKSAANDSAPSVPARPDPRGEVAEEFSMASCLTSQH
jgi:hypothetical protein